MKVMDRRALVLGGGGITGIAWETGVIAGLGIDLAAADVIIGTSAGSVVGTDIASGQELEALYQAQLAPPAPEPAARIGWGLIRRGPAGAAGGGRGPCLPCPRPTAGRSSRPGCLPASGPPAL